jgi:hypothetical protein
MKMAPTLAFDRSCLRADHRLTVLIEGVPVQEPTLLTRVGLRYTLIMVLDFSEENVNFICRQVDRVGFCRVAFAGDERVYLIEKACG